MPNSRPLEKYPPLLQITHWLVGLFVVCQLAIALILGQLRSLEYGQFILALHRQFGFAILVLSLVRLGAMFRHRVPSLDAELPTWQTLSARLVHYGFYVALIVQPILGMCVAWARGDTVTAFGLIKLPAPWDISDSARDRLMTAHIATAVMLLCLVGIHLGAVIFNHWKRRVPVVERMLPSTPADQLVNRVPVAVQLLAALGLVIVIALATGVNAIAKYRAFTEMTATYQETAQAAADETHAAQAAWKEMVWISSAGALDGNRDRLHPIAETTRAHLDAAASVAAPDARAAITAVSAQLAQLTAPSASFSAEAISDIDAHLQDLLDNQAASAQQTLGDIAERASCGHDLIVVTVVPMSLIGVILGLLLARSMSSSLSRLRILVRGIETNVGPSNITVFGRGEFAELMRAMVSMRSAIEHRTQVAADERFALEADRAREAEEQATKQRKAQRQQEIERQTLQRQAEQRQSVERRTLREQLARDFESQVAGIVDSVAATVDALKNTATQLALSAASTTQSSADASAVAETTKAAASRIADSSVQLSKTAQSVRTNAEQSKGRAVLGVKEASAARAEIDLLAVASGEISSITDLISGVTRQTQLLAINARIEAARAGDAGRGFCIVADEVKTLAQQTKNATEGIGGHVQQVGTAATRSIEILQNMGSIIADLEASSSSIFAACDDQSRSTEDIASKVTEISASAASVADNIAHAERTARATEDMATEVGETADLLRSQTNSLQDQVANFVLQLTSVKSSGDGVPPTDQADRESKQTRRSA